MAPNFTPLLTHLTTPTRPSANHAQQHFLHHFLRDTFTVQTWLALGACLQIVLFLLPIRKLFAVLPAVVFIVWRIVDTAMMTYGLSRNVADEGVLHAKFSALMPGENGEFSGVGKEPVVVFFLGFRVNHPLGPLAPGFAKIQQYNAGMTASLASNAATNGYLGQTVFLNAGARTTSAEIITVYYFRSVADVHNFAVGDLHREGWDWFAKVCKEYKHLGIMHELFESKRWETFYHNYEPTLFATTSHPVKNDDGTTKWISPVVEVKKNRLTTSAGRLGGEDGVTE